jgi:hypothetical protein
MFFFIYSLAPHALKIVDLRKGQKEPNNIEPVITLRKVFSYEIIFI